MDFLKKLRAALKQHKSCLCVGLDPDLDRIPTPVKEQFPDRSEQVVHFLKKVIDLTDDYAAAYKPNMAFFEALGAAGLHVFQEVIEHIPAGKIIIADGKRGDISSTAEHYARAYFEEFDVDAVTINPMMGFETLEAFSQYAEKGMYVLTLTSNSGAQDFFSQPFAGQPSMATYIADKLEKHSQSSATHIGMVMGATQPEKIRDVLIHHPESALLIPGIGAQGGSIKDLAQALDNHQGIPLVNSSRSILYAGDGNHEWKQSVADQAKQLKKTLQPITERYV